MQHISSFLAPYYKALGEAEKKDAPDEENENAHGYPVCSKCFINVCECIHN